MEGDGGRIVLRSGCRKHLRSQSERDERRNNREPHSFGRWNEDLSGSSGQVSHICIPLFIHTVRSWYCTKFSLCLTFRKTGVCWYPGTFLVTGDWGQNISDLSHSACQVYISCSIGQRLKLANNNESDLYRLTV